MPSDWANREVKRLKAAMFSECARSPDEFWAAALDAARAQGRREGLEEAALLVYDGGVARIELDADLAADIRARIEEPAAQEPTRVAIELSGEQLYLLIKFIQAFAGQSSVESAPQLRSIAEKLRASIEEPTAQEPKA